MVTNKNTTYSGTLNLINTKGAKIIVNFAPILLDGNALFYLSTNTKFLLSDMATRWITNQINFTLFFICALLTIVFSFIVIVMILNKNLKNEVKEKTKDLIEAFRLLADNNKKLQIANEKLIKNDERQKEFITIAAHELRTPAQAITGYCELNEELFEEVSKSSKSNRDMMDKNYVNNTKKIIF